MKAAAVVGVRDIEVVDIPIPKVEHDGVLIKVKACGICGSDLHVYNSGLLVEDSTKQISGFSIIGHEFAGEVVEVGRDVKDFEIGDRVSSIHNKGGMAEYCEVHGDKLKNLFKMPEAVSYEAAATLEPLCNPIHSFHLRVPKDNETVAIFGLGAIGLGYLQILKTYRKSKAIAVDISKIRLDMARRLGADVVIDANRDDPVDRIKELTG
ncbi:MAG: alcohol dehydrogenase catalytic domain-containing protein, partial [Candidatus Bathyarchaeia archaeon]